MAALAGSNVVDFSSTTFRGVPISVGNPLAPIKSWRVDATGSVSFPLWKGNEVPVDLNIGIDQPGVTGMPHFNINAWVNLPAAASN